MVRIRDGRMDVTIIIIVFVKMERPANIHVNVPRVKAWGKITENIVFYTFCTFSCMCTCSYFTIYTF